MRIIDLIDGTRVKVTIETRGADCDGVEHTVPAGAIATIENVRWIGGTQGWGVDVVIPVPGAVDLDGDPAHIVNTFDEGDNPLGLELAPVFVIEDGDRLVGPFDTRTEAEAWVGDSVQPNTIREVDRP